MLECYSNIDAANDGTVKELSRHPLRGGYVAVYKQKVEWRNADEHVLMTIRTADGVASWRDTLERNCDWDIKDLYPLRGDAGADARGVDRRTSDCMSHRDLVTVASYPTDGKLADRIRRDYKITARTHNQHLARAVEFLEVRYSLYTVYQPMGRTLREHALANAHAPKEAVGTIAAQVLREVAHLHSMRVAHCDITVHSVR